MVLACNNISKAFGEKVILDNVSFNIEDREKAAIVGVNGAGKTTLLKIIMGEMSKDSGDIIIGNGKTLGYLSQHQELDGKRSIYEEVLTAKKDIIELEEKIRLLEIEMKNKSGNELESLLKSYTRLTNEFENKGGFSYKSEVTGVIKGLGFKEDEFDTPTNNLSGGQKTRVSLGKLLLLKPDLLLLDEPTNHLDMESINWLETYLINYKGSVIVVAHDRYFLDRVVTKIVEVERGKVTTYKGNYSEYSAKKKKLASDMLKHFNEQQKEIKAQQEVIAKLRSFNREKSVKRAESREKLLNKIDVLDKPVTEEKQMSIHLEPDVLSGKDVLRVSNISKSFKDKVLFSDADFEIKRGERVAVIGKNGTGKTTLLKMITGGMEWDKGEIILGAKVHIGYYDQEHHVLNPEKSIFQEISDEYPNLDNTRIRNILAAFMFTGDAVFKKIRDLSGGERGRVSLAKLMLSEANFLILDEPTNHLDIMSKEILENALVNYTGTVLYVSHDRYFINRTATRILELEAQKFANYIGNYDYYLEKKIEPDAGATAGEKASEDKDISREEWAVYKEEQARERKKASDLNKTEEKIHEVEEQINNLDTRLSSEDVCSNPDMLLKLFEEKEKLSAELAVLYEKWENLV
ncbi:ribosomal protection-like ABC-F family protein [Parasporobacterium paucivorans]|uniref:ATP-binding cassette, subfamily F, member 3 n=1 Tax=Parasporobacterium paucivorans DSM 15970 TaxID=1122934 RepID=A0A1M6EQS1_9FIRM|nr:ATP-binding cassette, subfamily F, member 3 [Parasporobacterium paucivorans DSM 15970]